MAHEILKTSGKYEDFNIEKYRRSLEKANTPAYLIERAIEAIEKAQPKSTVEIHDLTTAILERKEPAAAARYNLKHALMELGPAGFPFENFVAELFKEQKYKVQVGQTIPGFCIEHEVDVLADQGEKHYMIECKFHNKLGITTDVKVALYIHARFEDIKKKWKQDPNHSHTIHEAYIVTNTRFTANAVVYGQCVGLKLIDWKFPLGESLADMITQTGLHPITALTYLTRKQKKQFIEHGFVLCKDAEKHRGMLKKMGLPNHIVEKIIKEAKAVCTI